MPNQTYCTLSDQELITKAEAWVQTLIDTGGRAWSLPVPANPDKDVDLVLSEVIQRFKTHVIEVPTIISNDNGTQTTIHRGNSDLLK